MFPYQNLEVYKKAFQFNKTIYNLLKKNTSIPSYLKNQLGRASLSIVLNIAEGSAKVTAKDRKNFLVIARGSTFECAAIVDMLHSENEISMEFKHDLRSTLEEISKMLYAMIRNLEK
jgi:four helix bundle protein